MPLILVVDDSMNDLLFLEEFLTTSGFECRLANSGEMALEHLKIEKFDLVISDFQMDDGDGLWLIDEIKKIKIMTKVILLSTELLTFGDGFSPKPIDLNHLKQQISHFIKL